MRAATFLSSAILATLSTVASGQYFGSDTVAGAEEANNTASFKPKFPLTCRPIDFESWSAFFETGSSECALRYANPKEQPAAVSGVSEKTCKDSFDSYISWQEIPGDSGSRRMFCNVAQMNIDTEMVRMNHYLDTGILQAGPLVVDHDVMVQFYSWYDNLNLQLFEQWMSGEIIADEAPKVSDGCADAVGAMMCSYMLPNCTYMPVPRWPYHIGPPLWPTMAGYSPTGKPPPVNYEKIYLCKETCEEVLDKCAEEWLPYPVNCSNFVSIQRDIDVDPDWKMTAYDRREAGGHACARVQMTVPFGSGTSTLHPILCLILCMLLGVIIQQ